MQVPKPVRMGYEGKAAEAQASVGDDLWELHAAGVKVLEFTHGRKAAEFNESGVLRAAVTMLLGVMAAAAGRIEGESEEMATRLAGIIELQGAARGDDEGATWRFVEGGLPELMARAAEELARWHGGGEMTPEAAERVWDQGRE